MIFVGAAFNKGHYIGSLYHVGDGYIVREVKPFARKVGPVLFEGRKFTAKEIELIRATRISSTQIDRHFNVLVD